MIIPVENRIDLIAHSDVIVVHSFSRFFRDAFEFEFYRRKLEKHGTTVVSMTQELGDDPSDGMMRQILNLFDEYQSKETAKHVQRAMIENARQGFWNGGRSPYGYDLKVAELRGATQKKKLAIDTKEAEMVRHIFDLYLDGRNGKQLGVKEITKLLNAEGYCNRQGNQFAVGKIHNILKDSTNMGLHYYNKKKGRGGEFRDPKEWIEMTVPVIIEPDIYDKVQQKLKSRRPTETPARLTNGGMLLTHIAKCPHCGGGMTLSTGKGGRYRYYACSKSLTKGKSACKGRRFPMAQLDEIVTSNLLDKIVHPDRLPILLEGLIGRLQKKRGNLLDRTKEINKDLRTVEIQLERLYDALAEGKVEDDDIFRRNVSKRKQRRDELIRLKFQIERKNELPVNLLSKKNLDGLAETIQQNLLKTDSPLRKAYIRHFVDSVIVGENEIRIVGSEAALLGAAAEAKNLPTTECPVLYRTGGANQTEFEHSPYISTNWYSGRQDRR